MKQTFAVFWEKKQQQKQQQISAFLCTCNFIGCYLRNRSYLKSNNPNHPADLHSLIRAIVEHIPDGHLPEWLDFPV